MKIYYHSWGDETVLGSRITIRKNESIYDIKFIQEGFDRKWFNDINVENGEILSYETEDTQDNEGIHIRSISIKIKGGVLNHKPEELFRIINNRCNSH